MKLFIIFELCLLMAMSSCIGLDLNDPEANCNYEEQLELTFATSDINTFQLNAIAGILAIKPSPDTNIYLTVTACARSKEDVNRLKIDGVVDNSELVVSFDLSDTYKNLTLDLEVLVPDSLILEINDSSGGILIENLENDLYLVDGSGAINIFNQKGKVTIHDGSGEIFMKWIENDIKIYDGSGDIDISNVNGNVIIEEDGSGSITVSDVEGDFVVKKDDSGSLRYWNIKGQVVLP